MPPLPDPSSTPKSAALRDTEIGLTALKQGDYPRAIALLETTTLPANHPLNIKAKMGLVVAYTKNGDLQQAITICRSLLDHQSEQVREWATRTLENLEKRLTKSERDGQTGRDIPAQAEAESSTAFDAAENIDLTGFVPFGGSHSSTQPIEQYEETTSATELESDATGFVPLADASAAPSAKQSEVARVSDSELLPSAQNLNRSSRTPETDQPLTSVLVPIEDLLSYQPGWRHAERAKQWRPLGKVDITKLIAAQVVTAIALFWVLQQAAYLTNLIFGILLTHIPFLYLQRVIPEPPVWSIIMPLVVLFFASRWVLDGLLTAGYGLQSLSLAKLANYSPEAVKAVNRYCRQKKVPLPVLGILPSSAPVAFSYGFLPRFTRVVVSQGLLEQLEDDEIATIFASEIGHIACRDVPLMSLLTVVNQIPFTIYWLISEWGNRQSNSVVRGLAIVLSAVSYGIFSLTRWIGLWLSSQRVYYSDHTAADVTGNPNGFTRALLKLAIGTAREVEKEGKTDYLLEGFELLSPLGHRQATTLGSIYPYTPLEPVLEWEWSNPYRNWLALTESHPPTGDRFRLLALYARHWRLPTEFDFDSDLEAKVSRQQKSGLNATQWRTLLLQGAPFFGLALGLFLALTLSLVGWVGGKTGNQSIAWMFGDRSLLVGFPLVGFSLGTFLRINSFFPDLKPSGFSNNEDAFSLIKLLHDPSALPVNSTPVRLEGQLLGRTGIANILSQDLLLKTRTGLVRLHCISPFGPIGNLFPQEVRFTNFLSQNLTATGWFRRGVTPIVDVDNLRTNGGRVDRSNHPVWSTVLGAIAAIAGVVIIAFGGLA